MQGAQRLPCEKRGEKYLSVPLDNACTTTAAAAAPRARTHGHTNKNAVQKSPITAGWHPQCLGNTYSFV